MVKLIGYSSAVGGLDKPDALAFPRVCSKALKDICVVGIHNMIPLYFNDDIHPEPIYFCAANFISPYLPA